MELSLSTTAKQAHIQISGTVDETGAEELKSRVQEIRLDSLEDLVFDFGAVQHIGSAGIGKLLLFYKDLAPHGGTLRIENPTAPIYDLLTTLKLDSIFKITR